MTTVPVSDHTDLGAERPIRVLVAIKSLAPGGAERLLVATLAAANREAFTYEVALVRDDADDLVPEIEALGVPVHRMGATSNLDPRWALTFRRLVSDRRYDIVHFHLPMTAGFGRPAARSLPADRRPVTLYTEHSMWDRVSPITKMLNRATVGGDSALITVSSSGFDHLPPALQSRAQVVIHGVDQGPARALVADRDRVRAEFRDELGLSHDALVAVTVANLRSEKGIDVLLDAARLVADEGTAIHFVSAGTGFLGDELAAQQQRLGLTEHVTFLGQRSDALRLLAGADMMVLPSRQEGLPVVLMEATSVGVPIVASAVGGVPQVLEDDVSGILVAPGDPQALARAIQRVADDPDLRSRLAAGAAEVGTAFDVARAAGELEDLYVRLLAERRR
jgi:glycosyltransferase involved in cell wall biosynthesis